MAHLPYSEILQVVLGMRILSSRVRGMPLVQIGIRELDSALVQYSWSHADPSLMPSAGITLSISWWDEIVDFSADARSKQ